MIAIVDYGAGNLFSVKNALDYLNVESVITSDRQIIEKSNSIILPGVGAFPTAMEKLGNTGLTDFLREQAGVKPFLGICLGMQMLFEASSEFGETKGLSLLRGRVDRIITDLKIPHMGWNKLEFNKSFPEQEVSPILSGLPEKSVYFVHSYMAYTADNNVIAYCDYGQNIPALVGSGNVYGCQFHPEKSGEYGLSILKNFADISIKGGL